MQENAEIRAEPGVMLQFLPQSRFGRVAETAERGKSAVAAAPLPAFADLRLRRGPTVARRKARDEPGLLRRT